MTRRILAIGTHPDDVEIGCGGTLAKCVAAGDEVHVLCITSGGAGSDRVDPEVLVATREAEARRAAEVLGARSIGFLGLEDGLTGFTRPEKIRLIDRIREIRPDRVFVHASRDRFPDHRIVHDLVMSALTAAAGPWYPESKGAPWSVPAVLGYEVWHPLETFQMAVDITDTLGTKLEALRCHASQMEPIPYDDAVEGLSRYRGALSGAGRHAEVFEVLKQHALI